MSSQSSHANGNPVSHPQLIKTAAADELTGQPRGSARAGQVGGEGELDTPPSNTVSNKYIQEGFRPLRWGVDSLYLSFPGEIYPEYEHKLGELKRLAQSRLVKEEALAQIELHGHIFEVKDKGSGLFPFTLEDNAYRIQLSRSTAEAMPMAYVKVSSEYLTHKTPEAVADDLRAVLDLLGNVDYMPNVSRIDLFVDFVSGFDMESWDRHAWITRASSINQYSVGGEFSGWTVGLGGDMAARLYNKQLELISSGKYYLSELWQQAGWQPDSDGNVWRMEFQFKREILSQFEVRSLGAVLNHLNGLWSYAATEWLKLSLPNPDDKNRSRWPLHPLWACIASVDFDTDGGPLSRQFSPQRVPSDRRLFDHGFSVLSSYMAREGISDFYQGMKAFQTALSNYLNNRAIYDGAYFDDYIAERIAQKARRFNSILNKLKEDDYDDAAEQYRKQSDGE
jgi:hypothetical protein